MESFQEKTLQSNGSFVNGGKDMIDKISKGHSEKKVPTLSGMTNTMMDMGRFLFRTYMKFHNYKKILSFRSREIQCNASREKDGRLRHQPR